MFNKPRVKILDPNTSSGEKPILRRRNAVTKSNKKETETPIWNNFTLPVAVKEVFNTPVVASKSAHIRIRRQKADVNSGTSPNHIPSIMSMFTIRGKTIT